MFLLNLSNQDLSGTILSQFLLILTCYAGAQPHLTSTTLSQLCLIPSTMVVCHHKVIRDVLNTEADDAILQAQC